jgi:hypothetical protein
MNENIKAIWKKSEKLCDESLGLRENAKIARAQSREAVTLACQTGVFTDDEFKAQLGTERANYVAVLKRLH